MHITNVNCKYPDLQKVRVITHVQMMCTRLFFSQEHGLNQNEGLFHLCNLQLASVDDGNRGSLTWIWQNLDFHNFWPEVLKKCTLCKLHVHLICWVFPNTVTNTQTKNKYRIPMAYGLWHMHQGLIFLHLAQVRVVKGPCRDTIAKKHKTSQSASVRLAYCFIKIYLHILNTRIPKVSMRKINGGFVIFPPATITVLDPYPRLNSDHFLVQPQQN